MQTDVSDETSMQALYQRVTETYGKADILVNNAVAITAKPLLENSVEEWDWVVAVNLRGAFLGIKLFAPGMLQRKSGVIITMQSSEGMPYLAPYLTTKVGLRSLAQSLAQELGDDSGVWVFCFGPGMVDSTPAINDALQKLAPLYNMTRDEFIRNSGGTLISAELCGLGLAGTVLAAQNLHGQETGYVVGLSRLGLDPEGQPGR